MKCEIINNFAKKEDIELMLNKIGEFIEFGTGYLNLETRNEYDKRKKLHYTFGIQQRLHLIVSDI